MPLYVNGKIYLEKDIGAVVIGFDEHISYPKILKAANYLAKPNCLFLASNSDETLPMGVPMVVPGTGVIIKAVETASQKTSLIFGKPSTAMFDVISKQFQIDRQRTLMIGDRYVIKQSVGWNACTQNIIKLFETGVIQTLVLEKIVK